MFTGMFGLCVATAVGGNGGMGFLGGFLGGFLLSTVILIYSELRSARGTSVSTWPDAVNTLSSQPADEAEPKETAEKRSEWTASKNS
jgi:hypothetical protein